MAERSIEKRIVRLEHEIERLHAVNEIQNLMSRYEYLHTAGLDEEKLELWAKSRSPSPFSHHQPPR